MGLALRLKLRRRSPRREPLRLAVGREKVLWIVTLRPMIMAPIAVAVFCLGIWYLFATVYLIARDELIVYRGADVAAVERHYRGRIADMQVEVERLTARHQVSQRTLEARIEDLLERQAKLENRHSRVAELAGEVILPPLPRPAPVQARALPASSRAALRSANMRLGFGAVGEESANPLADLPPIEPIELKTPTPADDRRAYLDEIERSLAMIEIQQGAALHRLADEARETAKTIRAALNDLGVPLSRTARAVEIDEGGGVGGLFIPIDDEGAFSERAEKAEKALSGLEALKAEAKKLPLAQPIPNARMTSGFGRRRDPFLGRPAMHAGIDFRARTGTSIYSPGPGTVVRAGRAGGYGNLIEIAHANGVTTRHAHLSRIRVSRGDKVETGTLIGDVGSTGRSTGPHLHYETRIGGNALNPTRFIEAGRTLAPLLEEN